MTQHVYLNLTELERTLACRVANLIADSRRVRQGDTFVAYVGEYLDSRAFIPAAVAAKAAAVLWEDDDGFSWDPQWQIPNVGISRLREQLGFIAHDVYERPSEAVPVIGVTGTNGKTSCTQWLAQCLDHLYGKHSGGIIGTNGHGFFQELTPSRNTTPDPISVHQLLAGFRGLGAKAVGMEVSSHGLDQGRVNGVHFQVAVLTNLSRDHLDYHRSMTAYAAAKAQLFHWPDLPYAVLNLDDAFGRQLASELQVSHTKVFGYGFDANISAFERQGLQLLRGENLQVDLNGTRFDVTLPQGRFSVQSQVIGGFNASNLLAVLGALLSLGIDPPSAIDALTAIQPATGRMQRVSRPGQPLVMVDYAHTPDALSQTLQTLRTLLPTNGRLSCVFGCGGDRDAGKRPLMGEAAAKVADRLILTSDNPRSEDPGQIIADIQAGIPSDSVVVICENRAQAITEAIQAAAKEDIVLIAGKGHEDYQEISGERVSFSDIQTAQHLLADMAW